LKQLLIKNMNAAYKQRIPRVHVRKSMKIDKNRVKALLI